MRLCGQSIDEGGGDRYTLRCEFTQEQCIASRFCTWTRSVDLEYTRMMVRYSTLQATKCYSRDHARQDEPNLLERWRQSDIWVGKTTTRTANSSPLSFLGSVVSSTHSKRSKVVFFVWLYHNPVVSNCESIICIQGRQ